MVGYRAKELILRFAKAKSALEEAKIIHGGSWKGDIGEYLARRKFGLDPDNTKGHDALDKKRKKVEIKTFAGKSKFPQFNIDLKVKKFDYAILVILGEKDLLPKRYYKIKRKVIRREQSDAEKKYKRFDLNQDKLRRLIEKGRIEEFICK